MIADQLSIVGFKASHGYVRGFLKRHDICNIVMHGQAGDANLAAAAAGVEKIRRRLDAYPPDRIYNMDETGLLYKCLPSRSYVPRRDRRSARGTKAMRSMDRVTLVLCTNATGSHKLPVAMVGTANKPLCFRGEGNASPLPYFAQKKAWMDKYVYAQWWQTVFLPAVREGHGGTKCALIMDNSSTHDVELSAEDVEILFLPPNTTAVYQPMDAGVIVSLKRRYKRRLLAILVRSLPVPLVPPPPLSPSSPPRPPQPPPAPASATSPSTTVATPPPAPSPPAARGFRPENEHVWRPPDVDVLQVYGAPRSAAFDAPDDAADEAAHEGLLAALLPPPDETQRPARNCSLAGLGNPHLRDAATVIVEEWEKVTPTTILHCWVKSTILPVPMTATLVSSQGEYRHGFTSVESEVDEVIALMRGTVIGREVIGGETVSDAREGVRAWLCAEDEEDAIVDTANLITMSTDEDSSDEEDEE